MKIIFFISSLNKGGAQRVMVNLANNFAKLGHDVGIITLASKKIDSFSLNPLIKRIELDLLSKNIGINKFFANYKRLSVLRQTLKNENPNVVVAFIHSNIVLAILASIGLPVLVFGSERNYPPSEKSVNIIWRVLRKLLYRFATGHIVQTEKTKIWLNRYSSSKNINIIPNSVVWPIPDSKPYVDPFSVLPLNRKVVLAVGTKFKQKGFDLLVQAFSKISKNHLDWDLVIIGIDPMIDKKNNINESIQYLAENLNVSDRVYLPGQVGNIEDWYNRADLFILSSRYEGFPNVLLEAMACGCPSIAFDCNTGPREIIDNGINGLLIPNNDIEKLKNKMHELMLDKVLRKKISLEAVKIKEKFSDNSITIDWLNVLQKSLDINIKN